MKIAIVTNFLYPEGIGGTELYCYKLVKSLYKTGHEVFWFVPNFSKQETASEKREDGINIVRFAAVDKESHSNEFFVAASFIKEIKARNISVAHFNELGGNVGISAFLVAETKKAGIATILTLHLVHYTCLAGTMKYGGKAPCDGKVIPARCCSCYLFSGKTNSSSINSLLTKTGRIFFNIIDKTGLKIFPRVNNVMQGLKEKQNFVLALQKDADVVVSLTKWFRDVLIVNGLPENKVVYLPQASPSIISHQVLPERKGYVFIGRVHKEKGIDLLLAAAEKLSSLNPGIFIDMYGPYRDYNEHSNSFVAKLKKLKNIHYRGVLAPDEVTNRINNYKALLLPSHVAEMAPLSIMEANKVSLPVIASDVPGSAELINQYDCGFIFKYDCVDSLVEKILAIEKGNQQFAFKQPFENDFNDVAKKYIEIYNNALSGN